MEKRWRGILTKRNGRYRDGYARFADGRILYDKDVAAYAKKHLRFFDRFDVRKVTEAALFSFSILSGAAEPPKQKNWKF